MATEDSPLVSCLCRNDFNRNFRFKILIYADWDLIAPQFLDGVFEKNHPFLNLNPLGGQRIGNIPAGNGSIESVFLRYLGLDSTYDAGEFFRHFFSQLPLFGDLEL